MKKSNLIVAVLPVATLLALASSTRCFAETRTADTKAEAKAVKAKNKAKVDLSSPDETVRSFVAAINAGDTDAMIACVYGAKPLRGKDGATIRAQQTYDAGATKLTLGEIKVHIDVRPIRLETVVKRMEAQQLLIIPSVLGMANDDKDWKILPRTLVDLNPQQIIVDDMNYEEPQPDDILLVTATALAKATQNQRATVEAQLRLQCVNNLKQVAVAAMQFCQEYDEIFAFTQADFVDKLQPYLDDRNIFTEPRTGNVFGMNPQMKNRALGEIQAPSQTVLFYTGKNGVLDFNYGGQAVIAYADGHVKAVSREQAAKLRWNP